MTSSFGAFCSGARNSMMPPRRLLGAPTTSSTMSDTDIDPLQADGGFTDGDQSVFRKVKE
jgi:hypothetical protein